MTVKYRVKTKHTKELLKEFVKFSFRVNHPKTTFRLFVIGVGFLIIGTGMERVQLFNLSFGKFTCQHKKTSSVLPEIMLWGGGKRVSCCYNYNDRN